MAGDVNIAVIGSGVSGLGAALSLQGREGIAVTLFEADVRPGGHAHTVDVTYGPETIPVDTGFIVYNELNYPELTAFFRWAGIDTTASDMSFALSANGGGFEWCGRHDNPLSGLFAQKRNLLSPGFYLFLRDILRFQTQARADVAAGSVGAGSLRDYLTRHRFSARLRDDYIVPMGAAIWSLSQGQTLDFPAESFLAFFENHRLLQWDRPRWRTVARGSRSYVRHIHNLLGDRLRLGQAVRSVQRGTEGVTIVDSSGTSHRFDAVIMATHAPTALSLLANATTAEQQVLGAFRVSANRVVLHRDTALMPQRRAAWAAWNLIRSESDERVAVTYWMNRLQQIPEHLPLFVTLNPVAEPAPDKVFRTFSYNHPVFDAAAIAAQRQLHRIQGQDRIWFAGAWTGYGFHEDGFRSGLKAAAALGGLVPWLR